MTWREILEGLAALPVAIRELRALRQVASINVASLTGDDVIVVECDQPLPQQTRERIAGMVKSIWPNQRVIVWDSGLRMRIVRDERLSETARAQAS